MLLLEALQPHLPPPDVFKSFCVTLKKGMEYDLDNFSEKITTLGYERVPLVETEGQWSRRGDIVDVFPVSSELPVRWNGLVMTLSKFGNLTPLPNVLPWIRLSKSLSPPLVLRRIVVSALKNRDEFADLNTELNADSEFNESGNNPQQKTRLEGSRRFLGLAFTKPASLLDYLPVNTLVAIDEPEQCYAHSDRWVENAEAQWSVVNWLSYPRNYPRFISLLKMFRLK